MAPTGSAGAPNVRYDIGQQHAAAISNVARDQYNVSIRQERESFLRDIAATKTKARILAWLALQHGYGSTAVCGC
jgi:DNA transposition AAA+ family ATPase